MKKHKHTAASSAARKKNMAKAAGTAPKEAKVKSGQQEKAVSKPLPAPSEPVKPGKLSSILHGLNSKLAETKTAIAERRRAPEKAPAAPAPRKATESGLADNTVIGIILLFFALVGLIVLYVLSRSGSYPFGDMSWIAGVFLALLLIAGGALTLNNKYKHMEFGKKMGMWGMLFLSPWALGFFLFFFVPMIQEFIYSFEHVEIKVGYLERSAVQFKHYRYLLQDDPTFLRTLLETMFEVFLYTALILVFSLLCAILLNGKFFGRSVARAIFFIPVVMATGLMLERVSSTEALLMAQSQEEQVYGAAIVSRLLFSLGVGTDIVGYLANAVNDIFKVVSNSGIQIIVFLAALQGIPPQLYEVARIEGATAYQTFWKVTVPMVSPMLLTCTLYTISDQFLNSSLVDTFQDSWQLKGDNKGIGPTAAMSVLFLLGLLIVLAIYILPLRKGVFYYD